ncbi:hypothetical protein KM043_010046 [Ampulex compressa]|nr:hypothetical protein KM043_010046 [Ampulex compressa]
MAPSRRKTRGQLEQEGIMESRYSRRPRPKRPDVRRRAQAYRPIDVPGLVYELLSIDKHNQELKAGGFPVQRRKYQSGMRTSRNYQRFPYEISRHRERSESTEERDYTMESGFTSAQDLTETMNTTGTSRIVSSESSSESNVSLEPTVPLNSIATTCAILKKKSLMQIINSYIEAGIEEGKRQAKNYIRRALSVGVKSGYLTRADPLGRVFHVCPTLASPRRADEESRRRRRALRKGEESPTVVNRKRLRRRSSTSIAEKKPRSAINGAAPTRKGQRKKPRSKSPAVRPGVKRRNQRRRTPWRNKVEAKLDGRTRGRRSKDQANTATERRPTPSFPGSRSQFARNELEDDHEEGYREGESRDEIVEVARRSEAAQGTPISDWATGGNAEEKPEEISNKKEETLLVEDDPREDI